MGCVSEAWTVDPDSRAQLSTDVRERSIAALARRQHGVVHHRQLIALGLSRQTIQRRVAARRLHPVHRGVYAVGHSRLTLRGRWIAAVLACSPGAALSHRDAGHLRNLRHSQNARIEVTVPAAAHPRRPGLRVHRTTLAPENLTIVDGIPVTSLARTLLDLAAILKPHLRHLWPAATADQQRAHAPRRHHHPPRCLLARPPPRRQGRRRRLARPPDGETSRPRT
jgi:hypothetical protein